MKLVKLRTTVLFIVRTWISVFLEIYIHITSCLHSFGKYSTFSDRIARYLVYRNLRRNPLQNDNHHGGFCLERQASPSTTPSVHVHNTPSDMDSTWCDQNDNWTHSMTNNSNTSRTRYSNLRSNNGSSKHQNHHGDSSDYDAMATTTRQLSSTDQDAYQYATFRRQFGQTDNGMHETTHRTHPTRTQYKGLCRHFRSSTHHTNRQASCDYDITDTKWHGRDHGLI